MEYTFITTTKKITSLFYKYLYVILFGIIFIGCNRCKLSPCVDSDEKLIFAPTSNNPNSHPNNTPAINNTSIPPMENPDITQEMIDRIQNRAARGGPPVGLQHLANVLRELKGGDKTNLNTPDPNYVYAGTALHLAAFIGDLEIVKALLKTGANIDAKNKHIGTPLCDAVRGLQVDVAAYLLSEGADKTITPEDKYGNNPTPYEMAEKAYRTGTTNQKAKRLVDMLKP
jgi:hypothetical protein